MTRTIISILYPAMSLRAWPFPLTPKWQRSKLRNRAILRNSARSEIWFKFSKFVSTLWARIVSIIKFVTSTNAEIKYCYNARGSGENCRCTRCNKPEGPSELSKEVELALRIQLFFCCGFNWWNGNQEEREVPNLKFGEVLEVLSCRAGTKREFHLLLLNVKFLWKV